MVTDTGRVRRDTTLRIPTPQRADSIIRRDSTGLKPVPDAQPHDTVKPPLTHAPVPKLLPSETHLHFTRADLFATGSLTLQDLLERVAGVTTISVGYIASPSVGTVAGDARRVRVFIEGIEYDALDPRANDFIDLSQVPIWLAEDVTIERSAVETRVHLRSWRVDRIDDYTRTDIGTGDQQANLYRAFYGKRTRLGGAIQVAAQQYSTTPPSYLGASADQLGIMGRFGWAWRDVAVDATVNRISRHRGNTYAFTRLDTIAAVDSRRTTGYLRVGYKDPDTSRVWAQIIASPTQHNFKLPSETQISDTIRTDTTKTSLQVFAGVGANRGPLSVQGGTRIRHADTTTLFTPVVTAGFNGVGFALRANYEGKSADSLTRVDAVGEFLPMPFVRLGGAVDRATDARANDLATLGLRAWAGARFRETWFDVGIIRRDSTVLRASSLIDATGDTAVGSATGVTASIQGRVWRSLYANVWGVQWSDSSSLYRPKYQTRSELFIRSSLPQRFPNGNFSFLVSARHEFRSATLIPAGSGDVLRGAGVHAITTLLEIRIATAVVSWQLRNTVGSRNYEAPDYLRPRTTNFYGVRWEFWN